MYGLLEACMGKQVVKNLRACLYVTLHRVIDLLDTSYLDVT